LGGGKFGGDIPPNWLKISNPLNLERKSHHSLTKYFCFYFLFGEAEISGKTLFLFFSSNTPELVTMPNFKGICFFVGFLKISEIPFFKNNS